MFAKELRWNQMIKCLGLTGILALAIFIAFPVADPLFNDPYSAVLLDRNGKLLGAHISADEQWRFPEIDETPDFYRTAVLSFEDKRFYQHPGVDPWALCRAMVANVKAGRVVSGGSTLTMQLARLSRKGQARTLKQKLIEIIVALRIEFRHSKDEILALYASHAPFGGNVVGLEAAAWRYFGKSAELLSHAEAACLAVLPNSPALIHPGRNRQALREKRNRLLERMHSAGILDSAEAALAKLETIPERPHPLPRIAPHSLDFLAGSNPEKYRSTIDYQLQVQANRILHHHHKLLAQNEIHNGAILVLDTENGEVLAYVGNTTGATHEKSVDMIQAERSSGSILKPFLYASAFADGMLLPEALVEDIPTSIHGYRPENFTRRYTGMIPADEALARSLNVPAVRLLQKYGVERFRKDLRRAGLTSIRYSADHYGLPLVLGGAEVSLWDLCGAYASMGRALNNAYSYNHKYNSADYHGPYLIETEAKTAIDLRQAPATWDYGSIWSTLMAMREVRRPGALGDWESFLTAQHIAWKTGTSFGFRDAWAVGVTPRYTIGVWVGNADGQGRPELIGIQAAAPILFDILHILPASEWWDPPFDALVQLAVCRHSGYKAGRHCEISDSAWVPKSGLTTAICPFHQPVLLERTGQYRIDKTCSTGEDSLVAWFVLPEIAEHYYKKQQPAYRPLPPWEPCGEVLMAQQEGLQVIYPQNGSEIYIPIGLDGKQSSAVFSAAHRHQDARIYWYLDETYLGSTTEFHNMEVRPTLGDHTLVVVDESGLRDSKVFEVLSE